MGVDYFNCGLCNQIFNDAGDYIVCDGCGSYFCSEKCAQPEYDEEKSYLVISCYLCTNQICSDDELIIFLCNKLNLTREQAKEMWKEDNAKYGK